MDIKAFEKQRDAELNTFDTEYNSLKQKYTGALNDAIHEEDPQKQAELVTYILEINSNLASEVRAFVSNLGEKYDPKAIQHLTDDLVKYQEEYTKIKQSNDMVKTLELILHADNNKLKGLKFQMNLYVGLLILGIAIIIMLIFWMSIPSLPSLPNPAPQ